MCDPLGYCLFTRLMRALFGPIWLSCLPSRRSSLCNSGGNPLIRPSSGVFCAQTWLSAGSLLDLRSFQVSSEESWVGGPWSFPADGTSKPFQKLGTASCRRDGEGFEPELR